MLESNLFFAKSILDIFFLCEVIGTKLVEITIIETHFSFFRTQQGSIASIRYIQTSPVTL